MGCLILFKSITYAQNGNIYLKNAGINSYLQRTPSSVSGGNCGYSLKIKCADIENAKTVLKQNGVQFIKSVPVGGGR